MRTALAKPGLMVSISVSVIFHGILIYLVALGWEETKQSEVRNPPRVVQATIVELTQKAPTQATKPKEEPKPKKIDLTKKKREAELAEKKRQARIAEKKRQKELEEKKKREAQKKAEEKRKQEELAKAEALKRQKALEEELERVEQERLQQQLQEEIEAAEAAERALIAEQQAEATAQSYVALISQRIEQFWSRPPSARTGMRCELLIQLVPTGRVVNVTIASSSGNSAFDRSAEQAVLKAEQFRELQQLEPEVFERYFRELRIVFNPQDLRL